MKENQDEIEWNEELVDKINEVKILNVINRMNCRKAVGPSGLPIEI